MAYTDCMAPADLNAEKGIMRKNWRNRIRSFLKSRSSKSIMLMKNRPYRPNVDDVNQWAQSLDKLLSHKYGKIVFTAFLRSEFCEENIEFWSACEDFRSLKWQRERLSKAKRIYEEFVRNEAPKEINLDYKTRDAITQSLQEPNAATFHAAQRKVHSLMENNSYPRFIQSQLYKDMCAAAAADAKLIKT